MGNQVWTKQNWKCEHLNDGTEIAYVTGDTDWENASGLARCAYNHDLNKV